MQFPNHRRTTTRAFIAGAAVAALSLSGAVGATAATTDPSPGPLELANAQLSKEAATQGMVLLENLNGALPMASSGNVALFGVGAYATVKGGTGSGAVNNRYTISVRDGFEAAGYTVTTSDAYWEAMSTTRVEQALTAESVAPTAPTDTAIFVVARNSGEGSDRSSGAGDYLLTDVERADLALIGQTYDNVVVVLNVGGIVDTSFFDEINAANTDPNGGQALDALFLMSQPGQEAGNALVEVLNGTVNPSGKLTDTWAASYDLYPASATFANADGNVVTEEYSEGIYVGYRYFDSFAKQIAPDDPQGGVLYPFGYGLSYTDFEVKTLNVSADMSDVTVRVKVTNTGTEYSGRDVVQVYFSAPQTGLDKPYQELAGYAKTAELAPRASQILTITFPTTEMSSYDAAQAAYVMDAGEYLIRVGDSSRNTKVAARVQLGDTVVTEQVSNELTDDQSPATVLVSSPELFYGYGSEAAEIRSAQRVPLHTKGFVATNHASALEQDVPVASDSPYYPFDGDLMSSVTAYVDPAVTDWEGTGEPYQAKLGETLSEVQTDPATTLYDVAAGRASLEQFVAGLSVTQLANIVEGTAAAGSTLTARGAAGYTTPLYENLGVPGMTLSDGPAGVRITQQWTTLPAIDTQYLTPPSGTGQGLQGNYYANTTLSGTPAATQTDPQVAFTWNGPPTPGVPGTNFSAKWTGTLTPPVTGTYTFGLTSDDGSRLVINGQQVIDNWRDQAPNTETAQVALTAGQPVQIEVDYYQGGGGAMVNLGWVLPGSDLITYYQFATAWPIGTMLAQTWDRDLVQQVGTAIGAEMLEYGATLWLAPGMNIHRDPLNGRNFEYFSEDPLVAGLTAAAETVGVQSNPGVGVTLKHYAANSQETARTSENSVIDERALREIYLKGFEIAVKSAQPMAVMTSYNRVNGTYAASNYDMNSDLLRGEWGFKGLVMTDWGGSHDGPVRALYSGNDLIMPGGSTNDVINATIAGLMRLGDLQRSAIRVLNIVMQSAPFGELAGLQGVSGVEIAPYSEQFGLADYLSVEAGRVSH